jgi:hypothetical protein
MHKMMHKMKLRPVSVGDNACQSRAWSPYVPGEDAFHLLVQQVSCINRLSTEGSKV